MPASAEGRAEPRSAWVVSRGVARFRTGAAWLTPLWLYLLGTALLLVRIGSHPGFAYNWESYTAWEVFAFWDHPSRAIFHLTDGLMTDSGKSPLIALPVWLSFKLFGVGLTQLRVPVVLIGAAAVPLTWLVGRRLAGSRVALLAAVLLALSPVFLLYGRTATLVGMSLTPALLTVYALIRVLQHPRAWEWLIALQVMLALDAYGYAVIRFLWPISLLLFLGELIWRQHQRWRFLLALVVTALALPLLLWAVDRPTGDGVGKTVINYYHARGEQMLAFRDDPTAYDYYLRQVPAEQPNGVPDSSADQLAVRLIRQNASDYLHLLIDSGTRPAITDYWNPHGRLYPWFLVPLFVLGLIVSLWHWRRVEDRVLQAMFWGFGLPLLLTSRVHIGRLIFVLPFLMLLVALGAMSVLRRLPSPPPPPLPMLGEGRLFIPSPRVGRHPSPVSGEAGRGLSARSARVRAIATLAICALIAAVGWSTWVDYRIDIPPSRDAVLTEALARDLPAIHARGGGAVLLLAGDPSQLQTEALDAASIRLGLDDRAPVVDLSASSSSAKLPTGTAPVYYGGLLFGRLRRPSTMPTFCQNTYYVPTSLQSAFTAEVKSAAASCPAPLQVETVPQ